MGESIHLLWPTFVVLLPPILGYLAASNHSFTTNNREITTNYYSFTANIVFITTNYREITTNCHDSAPNSRNMTPAPYSAVDLCINQTPK
ncbi:hypothetical protein [Metabacillus sp. SLBN-84]